MADPSKIAILLQQVAMGVNAHDRENPDHHTWGIGMANFDIERLGLDEGEELIPGIVLQADGGQTGQFRILCDGQHDQGEVEEEEEVVDAVASRSSRSRCRRPGRRRGSRRPSELGSGGALTERRRGPRRSARTAAPLPGATRRRARVRAARGPQPADLEGAVGVGASALVGVRHEQTAVYAADGYARATGRLGVAVVTTGPGAANTLGATGEAMAAGSPVLVIATDIATALRREGVYGGTLHETRDQTAMFVPVTKAARLLGGADEIARRRLESGRLALAAPTGPVYLGVPTDLLSRQASADAPAARSAGPESAGARARRRPTRRSSTARPSCSPGPSGR